MYKSRRLNIITAAPLACLLAAIGLNYVFHKLLVIGTDKLGCMSVKPIRLPAATKSYEALPAFQEYAIRIHYSCSYRFAVVSILAALIFAIILLSKTLKRISAHSYCVVFFLAGVALAVTIFFATHPKLYMFYLWFDVLPKGNNKALLYYIPALDLLRLATGIILAVCASTSIMWEENITEIDIIRSSSDLRLILFFSALVMAAGVWQDAASYAFLFASIQASGIQELRGALLLATGLLNTFILFSIYVPAALILKSSANNYVRANKLNFSNAEHDSWIKAHNLDILGWSSFARVLACFSPLIASTVLDGMLKFNI